MPTTAENTTPHFENRGVLLGFTPQETEMLADYGAVQEFAGGTTIIRQSQEQDSFYLILNGRVQVLKEPENENVPPQVIAELGANEGFGEMAIFNPPFAAATVVAMEGTKLWRLTRVEFQSMLSYKPDVGNHLFARLLQIFGSRV